MSHTRMLVQWFSFCPAYTNISISVNQSILIVCTILQQEGIDFQVRKLIAKTDEETQVRVEEINLETAKVEGAVYQLEIDLRKSKKSFDRFNTLVDGFGFKQLLTEEN